MSDQFTYCPNCGARDDQAHYRGCPSSGPVAALRGWKPRVETEHFAAKDLMDLRDHVVAAYWPETEPEIIEAVAETTVEQDIEALVNVTHGSSWRERMGLE